MWWCSCNTDNPQTMNFCGKCGTRLRNRCLKCGFENPPEFGFCGRCGSSLTDVAPVGKTNRQLRASHPAQADLLSIQASAVPEGERTMVTALFAYNTSSPQFGRDLGAH